VCMYYIYPARRIRKCLPALASGIPKRCVYDVKVPPPAGFLLVRTGLIRPPGRYGRTGRHLQTIVHIRRTIQAWTYRRLTTRLVVVTCEMYIITYMYVYYICIPNPDMCVLLLDVKIRRYTIRVSARYL